MKSIKRVSISVCTVIISLFFQYCSPYEDVHAIITQSKFILHNESGQDLWITNEHYPPVMVDSMKFSPKGKSLLLCIRQATSLEHPFPTSVFTRIEVFKDSAGIKKLVYLQKPVQNDAWICEKHSLLTSTYILVIHAEDLTE